MMTVPAKFLPEVTLVGRRVRLEPLRLTHLDALDAIGRDEDLWRWINAPVRDRDEMRHYIASALAEQAAGTQLPFVIIDLQTGCVAGSTRYGNICLDHKRVEIGWTWLGKRWQRTFVNTEAKYLLLQHAFESVDCIRVELKTDALNERSRRAIVRLGAKEEGTLRQHMITSTGRYRDTVYFSILDSEWAAVKAHLQAKLDAA